MRVRASIIALVIGFTYTASAGAAGGLYVGHGIAMHGDLKYGPNFKHFDYVNPTAP